MNSFEVFANDAEQFPSAFADTCDANYDLATLNVASHQRTTISSLQDNAGAPSQFRFAEEVCFYDEARQQPFGQHGVVPIFEAEAFLRWKICVEFRLFFREQFGDQILLTFLV